MDARNYQEEQQRGFPHASRMLGTGRDPEVERVIQQLRLSSNPIPAALDELCKKYPAYAVVPPFSPICQMLLDPSHLTPEELGFLHKLIKELI